MRDIVLFLGMLYYLPVSLVAPAAGLAVWEWVSLMAPHRLVYGFAYGMRFNLVIAVTTLVGWLISRERKRFTPDALPWVLLAFFVWSTLNLAFAPYPEFSYYYWNQTLRSLVAVFLVFILMNNKARVHGMVWVIVISLGFYGFKGGIFTILHGGDYHVFGPPGTQIRDNNKLALALIMSLPLIYYLARHTGNRILRIGLLVAIPVQICSILGSYSRGAFIALSVMAVLVWLRTKHKIRYAVFGIAMAIAALSLMPAKYFERIHTINNMQASSSFDGRLRSWHVAFWYATAHFPFGAGYNAPALPKIYHQYYPADTPLVAHSMYFQVLGDQGYLGLMLYLLVLLLALRNTQIIVRQTRNQPELAWAHDLAKMISISMISFCVGAAALSIAYWDGFLIMLALTSCVREITAAEHVSRVVGQRRLRSEASRGMDIAVADAPTSPGRRPAPVAVGHPVPPRSSRRPSRSVSS